MDGWRGSNMGADFYMEDHEEDHQRVERVEKLISKWSKEYEHTRPNVLYSLSMTHVEELKKALKASWEEDEEEDEEDE
jgi:hypothetical protein